ncbi:MAG TPA: glycogen/starch/alpha-glucan phosphorylase [Vicinamibacterales bacterium]|nr:glycogen/starch/alpha-glucan phosphorylase [Vicinamibacterales bacterium]
MRIPPVAPGRLDADGILTAFAQRMKQTVAKDEHTATDFDVYQALAYAVRDRITDRWFETQSAYYVNDAKRVYYLSLEFLLGRALVHNIINLDAQDAYTQAMRRVGYDLEALQEQEWDAGLGNGGLGRLAACIMESAATLGLPFFGYGIRYEYGIFRQRIENGFQIEYPDNWLRYGNPWEIPRPDAVFNVRFLGRSEAYHDDQGLLRYRWVDTEDVWAMAYDTPVVGFGGRTVNTLRLWSARSSREFDIARFNAGEYVKAVEDKTRSENISKILYPPDDQYAGKELRLRQQYFFISATLQDVLRRYWKRGQRRIDDLPDKVAIQLNDTHPVLAIPELMRLLLDDYRVDWERAWSITQRIFAYTNHTVLPEALERWPADLIGRLLPRHLEIIAEIDRRHGVAIIDGQRQVHMARLAFVGSHSVNGVAALHTEILKSSTFADLDRAMTGRINNKTNGITPRRWLLQANPGLARLIAEAIGDGWVTDLDQLQQLVPYADDAGFREQWAAIKRVNKTVLHDRARRVFDIAMDPDALFDCQVKRIHEYKRQLLNALHAIALYHRLRDGQDLGVPRAIIFAGKAAPGYFMAKLIIKLIHAIGEMVNGDPSARNRLQVCFLPNYSVSLAELVFPACELSEQISTAGTEASGTGNMKAALNGALTVGTLDGANIEIRDAVGAENMFIFGLTAAEANALRAGGYSPQHYLDRSPALARAVDELRTGTLARRYGGLFDPIVHALVAGDRYLHCADFDAYAGAHRIASTAYRDRDDWIRRSILTTARMGRFSSDRTTSSYADEIWGVGRNFVQ